MARIVLQYTGLYCRLGGLAGRVYRITLDCIMTEKKKGAACVARQAAVS